MRRHIVTAVKLAGLALLVWLVSRRLDPESVIAAYKGSWEQVVAAITLFFVAMGFRVAKWVVQARATGFSFDVFALTHGFLWGILLGVVTPMRVGEMYRVGALRKDGQPLSGGSLGLAAAALVLEKSYEVLTLASLVAVGALVALPVPWVGVSVGLAALGLAIFGIGSVPVPRLPGGLGRIAATLVLARDSLSIGQRLIVVGCTLAANLLNLWGAGFVYRMFGDLPWGMLVFGLPTITFTSAVPITISGVGLREMAAMEVFGRVGFPESAAAVAATLVFLGTNILPALIALPMEPFVTRRAAESR